MAFDIFLLLIYVSDTRSTQLTLSFCFDRVGYRNHALILRGGQAVPRTASNGGGDADYSARFADGDESGEDNSGAEARDSSKHPSLGLSDAEESTGRGAYSVIAD
ncbi:hypothetical protein K458DRAFT_432777 [Lentithecium fluviatile CBS 122367]|uniref:Uncharacterized protein n=1 Tax=Lentithecium fluviatile CBS 122367 TaxID=1168545 RepID=A0A6G1IXY1_9PLEO|nr:hypothetical protein K458DRAFT_432777 [Lentithecium fluviatile CBS 122367]